jgi:tight adherence protein B
MLIAIVIFVAVWAIFYGVYWLLAVRPEQQATRALFRRLNPSSTRPRREVADLLKGVVPVSTVPGLEKALQKSQRFLGSTQALIDRSGLRLSIGQFVLASIFVASCASGLAWHFSGSLLLAAFAGAAMAFTPRMAVRFAAKRRLAKIEEQFPGAIDLIARALRAGHAFTTGLSMVADEVADPVRTEFRLLYDKQNYGMALPDAMRSLAERVPLLDVRFFVTAVLTQRESGGNLSEVLDSLAAVIRDRFRLKRQVRVVSAHGRITGSILACLPIIIAGLLFLLAPQHMALLFTDPLGIRMVMAVVVLQVIGFFWMRKIVNIEI